MWACILREVCIFIAARYTINPQTDSVTAALNNLKDLDAHSAGPCLKRETYENFTLTLSSHRQYLNSAFLSLFSTNWTLLSTHSNNINADAPQAHKFQQDIARIMKAETPASELDQFISRCHRWLKTQPPDQVSWLKGWFTMIHLINGKISQHENLRSSLLLLYITTESYRKLADKERTVSNLQTECNNLARQLESETCKFKAKLEVADAKYAKLEGTMAKQWKTACDIVEGLRSQFLQISKWVASSSRICDAEIC